ncbi:MAG: prolipoprotein diacylglyceryl transferase, partial [Planctomycetota bacterium]|nr:prolipoprotein diacylglyceryl transferase [Planctomycetota bacterium]
IIEIVIGIAAFLAWLALHLRGRRDWVAANLNTIAVLVGLHLALSKFMGTDREITIYSFGVVIILGFLAGARFMMGQTDQLGLDRKKIFDWAFWMLVVGIIGARLLYAFLNYESFADNKLEVLRIWNGGLVWYGGLIPATFVGIFLLLRHKLPVMHVLDLGGAAVILALAIGRWACLLAGDDYGRATDSWLGIRFYHERSLVPPALRGVALHPTQLYMSVNCFWLFFAIEWVRRRARFAGQAFAAMLVLYAVSRAAWIEPFRGDFVERNPGYGKHLAASIPIDKAEGSPSVSLARGAVVTASDGTTGRLLEGLDLPAGKAFGTVRAISDGPVKPQATGPFGGRSAPRWSVSSIEGLPAEGVTVSAPDQTRWYHSDLPVPPGYVSTSQWISIFVVIGGVLFWLIARKLGESGFTEAAARHAAEGPPEKEEDA